MQQQQWAMLVNNAIDTCVELFGSYVEEEILKSSILDMEITCNGKMSASCDTKGCADCHAHHCKSSWVMHDAYTVSSELNPKALREAAKEIVVKMLQRSVVVLGFSDRVDKKHHFCFVNKPTYSHRKRDNTKLSFTVQFCVTGI